MQIDEWGQQGSGFESGSAPGRRTGSGGWNFLFTLTAIVVVTACSMGMAWVTRNVDERPVWMMGLIFMVPTAALMLGTMLVEGATSSMTPGSSRKPQIRLAIIVSIATFLVACICDLIYLAGFKKKLEPASNQVAQVQAADRLILIWDDTASMQENGAHGKAVQAAGELLDSLPQTVRVAMVSGEETVPFAPLTADQRARLDQMIGKVPGAGRMYYGTAFSEALRLAEEEGTEETVRVVFFSDGLHAWAADGTDPHAALTDRGNISLYWVNLGQIPEQLTDLLQVSGRGGILAPEEITRAADRMIQTRFTETVAAAEVPKEVRLQQDLIRNRDSSAKVITCVMMILEGLSLGICLSLMYSFSGQFRAQYIISPLMGALSFILLKYVMSTEDMSTWWIREGLCFSLLGVVLMTKNRFLGKQGRPGSASGWESQSGGDAW